MFGEDQDDGKDIKAELADLVVKDEPKKAEASESQPEKEAPAPSQEEPKKADGSSEDSAPTKEVPWHKHPRWIRMQNELKEARETLAKTTQKPAEEPKKSEETKEVPKQFQKLFGEDYEAYEAWKTFQEQQAVAIYKAQKEQEAAEMKKVKSAEEQAAKFAEDAFLELAEETGIDFHDRSNTERNQVLDICVKYDLFLPNGMPNVKKANELRAALYPPKADVVTEEKKKVATKTNAKTNAASDESKVFTSSKLKKMNISQFFNT